jgi:hypothetical protein
MSRQIPNHLLDLCYRCGPFVDMRLNDPILFLKNKEFIHGFFRVYDDIGKRVRVQVGHHAEWLDVSQVFVITRGYVRPIKVVLQRKKSKPFSKLEIKVAAQCNIQGREKVDHSAYDLRKLDENSSLLQDVRDLGFDISTSKLLTLDDFISSDKTCTNTMKSWINAGGQSENVYVPNPEPTIVKAVRNNGGHGFQGSLVDMFDQYDLPVINVAYLDFCGFLSSNEDSVRRLFSRGVLDKQRTLLHFTFCKREGKGTIDSLHSLLHDLCVAHAYGKCFRLHVKHSQTMWKGSFLIGINIYSM